MLNRISRGISRKLVDGFCISHEDEELYSYAAYCFLIKLFPLIALGVTGIIADNTLGTIIILSTFIYLRKYSGGYHAKSPMGCFVLTNLLIGGAVFVEKYFADSVALNIISAIGILLLLIFAPQDTENRRFTKYEKQIFRQKLKIRIIVVVCTWYLSEKLGCTYMSAGIAFGVIIVSIAVIMAKSSKMSKICRLKHKM